MVYSPKRCTTSNLGTAYKGAVFVQTALCKSTYVLGSPRGFDVSRQEPHIPRGRLSRFCYCDHGSFTASFALTFVRKS